MRKEDDKPLDVKVTERSVQVVNAPKRTSITLTVLMDGSPKFCRLDVLDGGPVLWFGTDDAVGYRILAWLPSSGCFSIERIDD